MNHNLLLGFIGSLLLVFLIGFCIADEGPSYQLYIQGGEISIFNGSNGTYVITVKDIVPYFYISNGEKNWLTPVVQLTNLTYPMNAALVLSNDNETTTMVQITNMSLSDGNKVLTLQVDPLQYYEGEYLQRFNDKGSGLEALVESKNSKAALYLEMKKDRPLNSGCISQCFDGKEFFCCQTFFPFP